MATINSKKLLPQSKSSLAKTEKPFLVPISNILSTKGTASLKPPEGDDTSSPESKLLKISKIISSTYLLEKSESLRKRKEKERDKSEQKEKQLETKKTSTNQISLSDLKRLPGQNILDRIKRFIGFTILGYLFNNFGKYLPQLLELGKKLQPAVKAFVDLSKLAFDGFVSLVDTGYKAYDFSKKTLKDFKANNYQSLFDDVSRNLDLVLATALAVAKQNYKLKTPPKSLGAGGATAGALGGRKGAAAAAAASKFIRTPYEILQQGTKTQIPKNAIKSIATAVSVVGEEVSGVRMIYGRGGGSKGASVPETARNRRIQKGILETIDKSKSPSNIKKSLPKGTPKPSPAVAGSRIFGRAAAVPIIGGLIDYIINTAILKEKPSRAAASAVGTTIGTGIGVFISGALGLGTGGIGAVLLGGAITAGTSTLGSMLGTYLYDAANSIFSTKSYARGGSVTRGGKRTNSAVARTVRRVYKKPQAIKPQKTQPGKDVGGVKKIEILYGEDKPGQKSGLAVLKNTSNRLKGVRAPLGINALMGASVDLAMGQKPDKRLYQQIGDNFGTTIASLIDAETNASINNISKSLAMAGGGSVPSREIKRNTTIGERIGLMVSSYLRSSIESSAASILQEVKKQILMKGGAGGGPGDELPIPPGDDDAGDLSGDTNTIKSFNYFKSQGYADFQAAAIVGNLLQENRAMNPTLTNSIGRKGIAQWDNNRWSSLEKFAENKGLDPNKLETQLQFVQYELRTGFGGLSSSVFKGTKDLEEAVVMFRKKYERPGEAEANDAQRIKYARSVLKTSAVGGPSLSARGVKKFSRADITSFFKQQESFRSKPHEGMDIAANQGTPISFGMGGTVLGVWRTNSGAKEANGGYGTYMDIKFSDGRIARMAHLSDVPLSIKKGTSFKANQIIAYSGGKVGAPGSGRSGGPHIHLEQLSRPMGSQETTKGKVDPLKGGLFDLIQRGGTKLSLAPTNKDLASGLDVPTDSVATHIIKIDQPILVG